MGISSKFPLTFRTSRCVPVNLGAMKREKTAVQSDAPSLPAWKAFVVPFSRETSGTANVYRGGSSI